MEERNYSEDIKIVGTLSEEITDHSERMIYWSDRCADAIFERDKSKNDLDVLKAQLGNDCRDNWETVFPKSPTVAMVDDWVLTNKIYQDAVQQYNEKTHQYNLLLGAKMAFESRSRMLTKLADLEIAGFHSTPSVSSNTKNAMALKHAAIPSFPKGGLLKKG